MTIFIYCHSQLKFYIVANLEQRVCFIEFVVFEIVVKRHTTDRVRAIGRIMLRYHTR